ncbi:5'-methylthioadenosine/adenosylhomocysteine nucleosidase [Chryseolinea sp. T2]|uniref:5'-methylthioadenosine/adenosylhomocysteine nucleosidase n=1 Tax=Chryseolinea sp. T2 TaxID=3129255 RepID=UPI0030784F9F
MNAAFKIGILVVSLYLPMCGLTQSIVEVQKEKASNASTHSNLIAILGAFPEEVKYLLSQVTDKRETIIQRTSFTTGNLRGAPVVVALTGIGKVNAATTTMLMIGQFNPRVVLFTGIAGGINPQLMPGDIVIGTKVGYHDYGTLTPSGIQRGPTRDPVTHGENPLYFSCDSSWISLAIRSSQQTALQKVVTDNGSRTPAIRTGVIVTGDVFVASDPATRELRQNMNAEATEMEGAAVGQVSYQQRVPFLIIRSMSDNAGSNASHDVKAFYSVAARNSAELVMSIVGLSQTESKKVK